MKETIKATIGQWADYLNEQYCFCKGIWMNEKTENKCPVCWLKGVDET